MNENIKIERELPLAVLTDLRVPSVTNFEYFGENLKSARDNSTEYARDPAAFLNRMLEKANLKRACISGQRLGKNMLVNVPLIDDIDIRTDSRTNVSSIGKVKTEIQTYFVDASICANTTGFLDSSRQPYNYLYFNDTNEDFMRLYCETLKLLYDPYGTKYNYVANTFGLSDCACFSSPKITTYRKETIFCVDKTITGCGGGKVYVPEFLRQQTCYPKVDSLKDRENEYDDREPLITKLLERIGIDPVNTPNYMELYLQEQEAKRASRLLIDTQAAAEYKIILDTRNKIRETVLAEVEMERQEMLAEERKRDMIIIGIIAGIAVVSIAGVFIYYKSK
jgi:hypothetical protein